MRRLALTVFVTVLGVGPATTQLFAQAGGGGIVPIAPAAGITIDAEGIVDPFHFKTSRSRKLSQKRLEAEATEHLTKDINSPSELRKVSLVRLEAAVRKEIEAGNLPPDEMQFLAGLQRIDYVFVYPETGDLVLAGPAEGFAHDAENRVVGVKSGRPPVRLDDLIVALRAAQRGQYLGCSIDPEPSRLSALVQFVNNNSTPASTQLIAARFQRMRDILGLHNVTVQGAPADSHYARVLVEADYRMKLISMDLEDPRIRGFTSHLALLKPNGNTMQRWWITPLYEAFYKSEDGDAFEFTGQRAQIMAQEENVSNAGARSAAPFTRKTTQKFAESFTDHFEEVAERIPVFAELQNLIDLAVVGALIRRHGLAEKVDWSMAYFLDEGKVSVASGYAPKQIPAAANFRRGGRFVLGLVGGGVTINAGSLVEQIEFQSPEGRRLEGYQIGSKRSDDMEADRWWWD